MLKRERLNRILKVVSNEKFVTVDELSKQLSVSDMTIRRDLNELDKSGKIIRIHGGAQEVTKEDRIEKNFKQKREIHSQEKQAIAQIAADLVQDGETIYVGPGTTLEFMVASLKVKHLRLVTNSLPVFEAARSNSNNYELILVGGAYRRISGAFIGAIANKELESMTFEKGFVGVNGINDSSMMTANSEEGQTQGIGLNRSEKKFVVADRSKLNHSDFFDFYSLYDVDGLITNQGIDKDVLKHYKQLTTLYQSNL